MLSVTSDFSMIQMNICKETATSCRQHMYHQASSCWSRWLLVAHLEVAVHSTVMDQKKHSSNSPNRRMKRPAPTSGSKVLVVEDNAHWDCSVCTYRNTEEAFKCLMCDVRKGTSTRKPRISPQIAAQQYNPTPAIVSAKNLKKEVGGSGGKEGLSGRDRKNSSSSGTGAKVSVAGIMRKSRRDKNCPPRLKNVDRSTAQTWEVTVNNVTVVVTEYKPKSKTRSGSQLGLSGAPTAEQDRERTGVGAGGGGQMSSASSENGSQSGEESSVDLARGSGGELGTDSRSS